MSVTNVLPAVREGIASVITAGGVRCEPYDSINTSGTIATLGLASWSLDHSDQSMGVQSVTIPVFVYQLFDGSGAKSIQYLEDRMSRVVDAIGADRTLGGVCPSCSIEGDFDAVVMRGDGGQLYGIATLYLTLTPFSNVGE